MNVSIHSINEDAVPPSKGKETTYTDNCPLRVNGARFKGANPRSAPVMWISGTCYSQAGTGERGGEERTIRKTLQIELTKQDVSRIVEEAFKSGLYPLPGNNEMKQLIDMWQQLVQPNDVKNSAPEDVNN